MSVKPDKPRRDDSLDLDDRALLAESRVDTFRASGPGGQKRNKTDSAVRIRHNRTEMVAIAVESRSQHENKRKALKRLRLSIALHIREPIDINIYEPGPVLAECLTPDGRLRIGRKDARYYHVVAEVLDLVQSFGCRISSVAQGLGISTASFVAFVRSDPKLWARVNTMRTKMGLNALR